MTRRGRFSHRLWRIREPAWFDFDGHDSAVVLSLDGSTVLNSERDTAILGHADAAILVQMREASFRIAPAAASNCYLILLREHRSA
jgi:uncharacterized protein